MYFLFHFSYQLLSVSLLQYQGREELELHPPHHHLQKIPKNSKIEEYVDRIMEESKIKNEEGKTRQDKTRRDKIRQDETRQDKTRQDKTRQGIIRSSYISINASTIIINTYFNANIYY